MVRCLQLHSNAQSGARGIEPTGLDKAEGPGSHPPSSLTQGTHTGIALAVPQKVIDGTSQVRKDEAVPSSVVPVKSAARVAAGEANARVRWGPPRVARLDDLTPAQRHAVLALVDAMNAAKEEAVPAVASAGTAERTEGHGNGDPIAD